MVLGKEVVSVFIELFATVPSFLEQEKKQKIDKTVIDKKNNFIARFNL